MWKNDYLKILWIGQKWLGLGVQDRVGRVRGNQDFLFCLVLLYNYSGRAKLLTQKFFQHRSNHILYFVMVSIHSWADDMEMNGILLHEKNVNMLQNLRFRSGLCQLYIVVRTCVFVTPAYKSVFNNVWQKKLVSSSVNHLPSSTTIIHTNAAFSRVAIDFEEWKSQKISWFLHELIYKISSYD